MAGTSWPALVAGARARASDVEAKLDWLEGNIVPMTGGSATDAAYDLGTSAARWRDGYFSRNLFAGQKILIGGTFSPLQPFQVMVGSDQSLQVINNGGLVLRAVNDSQSASIPLSFDATAFRFTQGNLALAATTTAINEFSTDGTLAGNSDLAVPTEKAIRTYVASQLVARLRVTARLATNSAFSFGSTGQRVPWTEDLDVAGELSGDRFVASTNGTYDFHFMGVAQQDAATTTADAEVSLALFVNSAPTHAIRLGIIAKNQAGGGSKNNVELVMRHTMSLSSGDAVDFLVSNTNAGTTTSLIGTFPFIYSGGGTTATNLIATKLQVYQLG